MRVVGRKKDDDIWRGDCMKVFISERGNPRPYFHFIDNPWNVKWKSTTKIGARKWTAELALP